MVAPALGDCDKGSSGGRAALRKRPSGFLADLIFVDEILLKKFVSPRTTISRPPWSVRAGRALRRTAQISSYCDTGAFGGRATLRKKK